uniref:Uncharacterized protein n=1 Tax=Globodera rostochiensis TaxID=31243 RepID=A0A914GS08_GLORO
MTFRQWTFRQRTLRQRLFVNGLFVNDFSSLDYSSTTFRLFGAKKPILTSISTNFELRTRIQSLQKHAKNHPKSSIRSLLAFIGLLPFLAVVVLPEKNVAKFESALLHLPSGDCKWFSFNPGEGWSTINPHPNSAAGEAAATDQSPSNQLIGTATTPDFFLPAV